MNALTQQPETIFVDDLNLAVEQYTSERGYRLDMIVPADSPIAALLSRREETVRLETTRKAGSEDASNDDWVAGRAGMMYRDLISGRLGGKLIASHIRLTVGGEVPDYVHYHKVQFQMIFCVRGPIKVVYENQGGPFWLRPGDCVLQPPEIRHRVLWAEEGSEVVEIGMPAAHETWVEHEMTLPSVDIIRDRDFSGQRFVRHIAAEHQVQSIRDTGIAAATGGFADVRVARSESGRLDILEMFSDRGTIFGFVISGEVLAISLNSLTEPISEGGAFTVDERSGTVIEFSKGSEILLAAF